MGNEPYQQHLGLCSGFCPSGGEGPPLSVHDSCGPCCANGGVPNNPKQRPNPMQGSGADLFSLDDHDQGFDDAQQEFADDNLAPSDVLGRIEEFIAEYLNDLAHGTMPALELVSRSKANSYYQAPDAQAGVAVALGSARQKRCMLANQASAAHSYLRVFMVLQTMHQLLRSGCTATQRDVYYKLASASAGVPAAGLAAAAGGRASLFAAPRDVDSAIQDVVALLRVPRSALGITCASRGAMAGLVYARDSPTAPWQDCTTLGTAGKAIPGSLAAIDALGLRCTARYLLIVEKDAVFQRLVEDGMWHALPCVLVTAKGMPDLATRALCAKLVGLCTGMVVLGLVDYNPHGVVILKTYKFGSHRMGLECHKYALPGLHWLGLRSSWLIDVDARQLHQLTSRDLALLPGLKSTLAAVDSGAYLGTGAGAGQAGGAGPGNLAAAGRAGGSGQLGGVTGGNNGAVWGQAGATTRQAGGAGQAGATAGPSRVAGAVNDWDWDEEEEEAEVAGAAIGRAEVLAEGSEGEDGGGERHVSGTQMRAWVEELEVMQRIGYKADIESLYSVVGYEGLKDMVVQAVQQKLYI